MMVFILIGAILALISLAVWIFFIGHTRRNFPKYTGKYSGMMSVVFIFLAIFLLVNFLRNTNI